MIDIQLQYDSSSFGILPRKKAAIEYALVGKMDEISIRLATRIEEKLSGAVLQRRSGRLAGSVVIRPAEVSDNKVMGGVSAAGADAPYGVFHEYGVSHAWRIIAVDKKVLRFLMDGEAAFAVHVTHPPLPVRSFMRSVADEERDGIGAELRAAIILAMVEAG